MLLTSQPAITLLGAALRHTAHGYLLNEFLSTLGLDGYCAAKAAQDRLTALMTCQLAKEDVFVGKVVVGGKVKGTAFDDGSGDAKIEPDTIADAFWKLNEERTENEAAVNDPA